MDSSVEVRAEQLGQSGDARRLWLAAAEVMDVQSVRLVDRGLTRLVGRPTPPGEPAVELRGRFLVESDRVYDQLEGQFRELGYVLLLRKEGEDQIALGIPGELPKSAGRPWIAIGMFVLTVLSTLWVGSGYSGQPDNLLAGWPFTVSLLGILLTHEMGHYVVARRQKIPATLPYFIPFPTILGTMGAVIQIKAPPRNRRDLLMLGAAGPLAGLVVAIPVLLLGLSQSSLGFIQPGPAYFQEGNSLLYAALKFLVFGRFLPSNGMDVMIGPVAFAGWAGLLVTGMNLNSCGPAGWRACRLLVAWETSQVADLGRGRGPGSAQHLVAGVVAVGGARAAAGAGSLGTAGRRDRADARPEGAGNRLHGHLRAGLHPHTDNHRIGENQIWSAALQI